MYVCANQKDNHDPTKTTLQLHNQGRRRGIVWFSYREPINIHPREIREPNKRPVDDVREKGSTIPVVPRPTGGKGVLERGLVTVFEKRVLCHTTIPGISDEDSHGVVLDDVPLYHRPLCTIGRDATSSPAYHIVLNKDAVTIYVNPEVTRLNDIPSNNC